LGASGFVGSHLAQYLTAQSIPVVTLGSAQIDLCGSDAVEGLKRAVQEYDTLVFISALTPDKGRDIRTLMRNIAMGENVGNFLEASPCAHMVYISSDAVYSDDETLLVETTRCDPSGFHGVMHLARERMMQYSLRDSTTPALYLRSSLLYGPGDTHNGYGPNRFMRTASEAGKISLFGQGEDKRDHVYIKDFAQLLGLCLSHASEGILNVATGVSSSFQEVATTITGLYQQDGKNIEIENLPQGSATSYRHFDISTTLKAFPSFHYRSLQVGLSETLNETKSA